MPVKVEQRDMNQQGVRTVQVDENAAGQRIDNFLRKSLGGVPKSHIYRLLRTGQVRVNKGRKKPDYKLSPGDEVRIPPVLLQAVTKVVVPDDVIARVASDIVFEDGNVIVLNKKAGLAVHAGSGLHFGLIDALRQQRGQKSLELVHRLDRGTSGCLMIAKSRTALLECQQAFRLNSVRKEYLALVAGVWQKEQVTVSSALKKNNLRGGERMVQITADGKPAVSHFTLLEQFSDCAQVRIQIETGRTHQIRVHAASIGHPVIGDEKYGDQLLNRQMRASGLKRLYLHAEKLILAKFPGYDFNASPDKAWEHDVHILRKY